MASTAPFGTKSSELDAHLRDDLHHADQALVHMAPILRHLLQNDDSSIFSDDIIARVRGMLADIARQLAEALGEAAGQRGHAAKLRKTGADLADALTGNQALLDHLHMLAIEWQLTEKLHVRLGLDPVLTPLLQDLIASPDPDIAARGMNLLAAQARFGQCMRRMQIPLLELPADLLQSVLTAFDGHAGGAASDRAAFDVAKANLRHRHASGTGRLELLDHLTTRLGQEGARALRLDTAGVAIFLTALASAAAISREMAVMCTTESQAVRLALTLSAASADRDCLVSTFMALHPEASLPEGLDRLGPEGATSLLATSLGQVKTVG